jgi:GNAT superfamily N-acetyltransferase
MPSDDNHTPIKTDLVTIRPLADSDSIEDLTALLHRGYRQLADMGLRYLATYQNAATTRERISRGECFVATYNDRIIGTLTFYMPGSIGGSPWLKRDDVAEFGQFAVDPPYQGNGVGGMMVTFIENYARKKGIRELALDTSEQAEHLIEWYTRMGYRFIEYVQWDVTNYRSVILSKAL